MKRICESRLCDKEIDINDCHSYTAINGEKVFWCNEDCYLEHIGQSNSEPEVKK